MPEPGQLRVGCIGLGIMGGPMAGRLLDAGHPLSVWNRTASKAESLVERGAQLAESPEDLAAAKPDVVVINVTDTPDVEHVVFGEHGVMRFAEPGLVIVDHSTISPVATVEFGQRCSERGVSWVDAPVSGGDVGAQNGTLSVMVGGPGEAVEHVRPVLEAVGQSIVHLGPTGSGQACKACNQVAVANALLGTVEALALAEALGLDRTKMLEVVAGGAAGSWQLANLGPKIVEEDFAPGFMIELMLKDLAIVADAAESRGVPLRGAAVAESYYRAVRDAGGGRLGTQAMARALSGMMGAGSDPGAS